MRISCPKCHEVQDADDKTSVCPSCRAILRRCADCAKFDIRMALCKAVNRPVQMSTAWYPTHSSESTYCRNFAPAKPPADATATP